MNSLSILRLLTGCSFILMFSNPLPASEPNENRPASVHQVLSAKPQTMMLDYFTQLATGRPINQPLPKNKAEWMKRRAELRRQLWQSLGNFPREKRPPLNARITGTIDHGDHVVEKILYESLPGLYVTALAYVPKKIEGRAPVVICVNGHWSDSKATLIVQRRCMGLARMGVIAFCQDVIGTGERQAYDGSLPQSYHGFYRGATPRIVDRSLLGYVMYECMRALDYLLTRDDVDPKRILCTGASGGGKQSMYFPALDDRLAGGVPVCYVSSYQAHMGATACVGEIPTNILRYSNQWEVLALHAPRPLLCIAASRDVPVFLPRHVYATLEQTKRIYQLYDAAGSVRSAEVDSKHDYNQEMREILYSHVAEHFLRQPNRKISEPDDLPVEKEAKLRVGLPAKSETMQSLTYRRAKELAALHTSPKHAEDWAAQRKKSLPVLKTEIFGGFPDSARCRSKMIGKLNHNGYRVEHWTIETEPGVIVPAVLCLPGKNPSEAKRPAVLVVDEDGKQKAFERGLIDRLVAAGHVVLAIDYRGAGETAGTVPAILYGPGTPEYNLSNYGLFNGRPITGMRIFDVRCATDFLTTRPEVDAKQIALAGRGRGALVAMLSAAFDERIQNVATEELLSTWVFEDEFVKIGLAYMIPRILTIGDMEHLAALLRPRKLLILNPIDGRRRHLSAEETKQQFAFTESVYRINHAGPHFNRRHTKPDEASAELVKWLAVK
jgi:cephalosporin-C deacetylase-like acetyl esterase